MSVRFKLNGFFLLFVFGALCGVITGAFAGFVIAGFVVLPGLLRKPTGSIFFVWLLYGPFVGICMALIPGILFGLTSCYFTKRWHWVSDGGFYGAVCYFIYAVNTLLWIWPIVLVCVIYGCLVGYLNTVFPNWWGMRLRAEGIELLRAKN